MTHLEPLSEEIVSLAEASRYGFGTNNLTYYVDQKVQSGVIEPEDANKLLTLSQKKANKVCPARSIEKFKKYAESKGIVLNFRAQAFLESDANKKPKYDFQFGDHIAEIIMEVFRGYRQFDKVSLLEEMKQARLKQIIENQIQLVKQTDY